MEQVTWCNLQDYVTTLCKHAAVKRIVVEDVAGSVCFVCFEATDGPRIADDVVEAHGIGTKPVTMHKERFLGVQTGELDVAPRAFTVAFNDLKRDDLAVLDTCVASWSCISLAFVAVHRGERMPFVALRSTRVAHGPCVIIAFVAMQRCDWAFFALPSGDGSAFNRIRICMDLFIGQGQVLHAMMMQCFPACLASPLVTATSPVTTMSQMPFVILKALASENSCPSSPALPQPEHLQRRRLRLHLHLR